jgi:hypothetical protein
MKGQRIVLLTAAVLCCLVLVAFVRPRGGHALPAPRPQAHVAADTEPPVRWWVVSPGGGRATTGDGVVVQDTLGQPVTGPGSGGAISLGAGYSYGTLAIDYDIYLPLVLRNT